MTLRYVETPVVEQHVTQNVTQHVTQHVTQVQHTMIYWLYHVVYVNFDTLKLVF